MDTTDSDEDIKEASAEEGLIDAVYNYLTSKKYPDCCAPCKKRQIRKKAEKFLVVKGELFYQQRNKQMVRYIRSRQEQLRIVTSCHVDPTSGHLGVKKTVSRVNERFAWKGIIRDVQQIVSTCDICQRVNGKLTTERPELHPVPVQSPWYHIGVDFVGPISPPSSASNRYILTISDYYTKWVKAIPLPTKEAPGVAASLLKVFMRMGLPKLLTTDQWREFKNKLDKEMMSLLGVKRHLVTPYHPQANGLDERWNQTMKNMLVKFTGTKKDTWDEHIDSCVFAYNTSCQESTKYSPFQVMFGRVARLPVEVDADKEDNMERLDSYLQQSKDSLTLSDLTKQRTEVLTKVKNNILAAQKKQKDMYDQKHASVTAFRVGAKVLKKDFLRKKRKGGKMDPKWLGPFEVAANLGKVFFSLQDTTSKKIVVQRVNGAHLKLYTPFLDQNSETSVITVSSVPQDLTYSVSSGSCRKEALNSTVMTSPESLNSAISLQDYNFSIRSTRASSASQDDPSSFNSPIFLSSSLCIEGGFFPQFFPCSADIPSPIKQHSSSTNYQPSFPTSPIKQHSSSTSFPTRRPPENAPTLTQGKPNNVSSVKAIAFKQWCARRNKENEQKGSCAAKNAVVDLDEVKTPSPEPQQSIWVSTLTTKDEKVLLNGGWLTDSLIDAGQKLIKQAYPSIQGLQDIALGQTLGFGVMRREFVQILHTGRGHWVTVSTIGCQQAEVDIFDSASPALNSCLENQIAALLHTDQDAITVRYRQSQLQQGTSDCGLFALAFAAVLASGEHPSAHQFQQSALRKHLHTCLSEGTFSCFPTSKKRRNKKIISRKCDRILLYCYCRMPEHFSEKMIVCEQCKKWFHLDSCVVVSTKKLKGSWFCSACM